MLVAFILMIVSVLHLWDSKPEQKLFKIKREAQAFDVCGKPDSDEGDMSEGSTLTVKVGSKQSKMLACDVPLTACAINWTMHSSSAYFSAG